MRSRRKEMGGISRRNLLTGFALALFLGTAVYFRIWSMDPSFTTDAREREILRREFERANMDAMDESAEWRMKYDGEVDRTRQCQEELLKTKGLLTSANERLSFLRKENIGLQKQVETLTQRVADKQQNCDCAQKLTQH